MEYRVLGPLEVYDGQGSLPLAGAKQRALLALLLVHANHVLSRDRLIDELWGDEPPETAVQSLQVYVSRLRKLLPAETLLTRSPGYLLAIEPAELDLHCFERRLGEGRDALAEGDPERAATALHDALGLWRGPALAEFTFEPFAQAEIGRLESLRTTAVEERIEADLALGRHAELVGELEALVAENPFRERFRGQLMLALYRSGRRAEALEAYRNARLVLVEELGIEPSARLQRLEKSILDQDDDLDTPAYGGPSGRAPPPLERKLVTVLFADLGMANELEEDPERIEASLAEVYREAQAEIEAAGGTVERGIAGALIATFGAPHAREEDHALRAVSAALATRNRLSEVFGDALWLRMSVESGEVILGVPGSFVTGRPVGAVARLIRYSAPGEVVVGERAATKTCGAFELVERDGAYVLVGMLTPTRSPAQSARRRRRSRAVLAATGALLIAAALATAAVVAAQAHHSPALVPPDSVGIIDPETNKVVGHVLVGRRPDGVAFGANAVWVANLDDKTLSRINPKQRIEAGTVQLGATPTGLAVGFGSVWVAGSAGTLSRVAPQNGDVETIFPSLLSSRGDSSSITLGAGFVWVAFGGLSLSRINPMSGDVATIVAGNTLSAIAADSQAVWVADAHDSSVMRINPRTNGRTPGRDIDVGLKPAGITVGGGDVWVTDTGDDSVTRIDPSTNSVRSITVGEAPLGIVYGAGSVWVANSGDGTVSRVDPTTEAVATIRIGNSPRRIAFADGKIWVTVQERARTA